LGKEEEEEGKEEEGGWLVRGCDGAARGKGKVSIASEKRVGLLAWHG